MIRKSKRQAFDYSTGFFSFAFKIHYPLFVFLDFPRFFFDVSIPRMSKYTTNPSIVQMLLHQNLIIISIQDNPNSHRHPIYLWDLHSVHTYIHTPYLLSETDWSSLSNVAQVCAEYRSFGLSLPSCDLTILVMFLYAYIITLTIRT